MNGKLASKSRAFTYIDPAIGWLESDISTFDHEHNRGIDIHRWSMFTDLVREQAEEIHEVVKDRIRNGNLLAPVEETVLDRIPFNGKMYYVVKKNGRRLSTFTVIHPSFNSEWEIRSATSRHTFFNLWSALFSKDSPLKPLANELYRRGWILSKRHDWRMKSKGYNHG